MHEFIRGQTVLGLHPRSPLVNEAIEFLDAKMEMSEGDIEAIEAAQTELINRIERLQGRRDQMRAMLFNLTLFNRTGRQDTNQRRSSSQPESEPAESAD